MNDAQYALLGALFGGAGLKVLGDAAGKWLSRGKEQFHEQSTLRRELRDEIAVLRKDLVDLKAEVDEWKEKYYKLLQEYLDLSTRYKIMESEMADLRGDNDHLEERN